MKYTLEELLELLTHHDTVIARLTGLGETELCSAEELYKLLDKATVKKVLNIRVYERDMFRNYPTMWRGRCPCCNDFVYSDRDIHFHEKEGCGQAIAWKKKNE